MSNMGNDHAAEPVLAPGGDRFRVGIAAIQDRPIQPPQGVFSAAPLSLCERFCLSSASGRIIVLGPRTNSPLCLLRLPVRGARQELPAAVLLLPDL